MTDPSIERSRRAGDESAATRWSYRPDLDIMETPDEMIVAADMPGSRPERIDVTFEDGLLTLHAPVADRQPAETAFHLHEYGVGSFDRRIRITPPIAPDRIEATYADGVLTVRLPKSEDSRPRSIPIRSA